MSFSCCDRLDLLVVMVRLQTSPGSATTLTTPRARTALSNRFQQEASPVESDSRMSEDQTTESLAEVNIALRRQVEGLQTEVGMGGCLCLCKLH